MKAILLCCFAFLILFLTVSAGAAETRTALIMGVWDYSDPMFAPLRGVEQDVAKMRSKLKALGFEVTVVTNPTLRQAKDAVDTFGVKLASSPGVGLFYFSGHGSEHEGINFLIPKGTDIKVRKDLEGEALSAQRILARMEDAKNGVNLVFLDCCRNGLTRGSGAGLAPMQANGTFVGFATASQKEAYDSAEGSPYTAALLEGFDLPGISILDMHTRVTKRVKELTQGEQSPFQYSGLDDVFYMVPKSVKLETRPAMTEEEMQRRIDAEVKRRVAAATTSAGSLGSPSSAAPPPTPTPAGAFTNSLGMKFVAVPGTNVMFCIHDTRKSDYRAYAAAHSGVDESWKNVEYKGVPVSEGEDHPVVMVSWEDAQAFCKWLSATEGRKYRLPKDHEWSVAVGIGNQEDATSSPASKSGKIDDVFPWGTQWPPPKGVGNFADSTLTKKIPSWTFGIIEGYNDGYATTSPVMSFSPNKLGLYDMAGNVWQWCEEWYDSEQKFRVLRGGSWSLDGRGCLLSSCRFFDVPARRLGYLGFRVVVER